MEDNNINQENIDQNTSQNSTQNQNAEKLQEISDIYNPQYSNNGGENIVLVNKSPIEYYIQAFQKYAQFSGRATRAEYWWFYLVTIAVSLLLAILDSVFSIPFGLISIIYGLVSLIPQLAIQVRRLHDVDKSGWLLLLPFAFLLISFLILPIIGFIISSIWIFRLYIRDSTPGSNKYGPNPKGVEG
jgi:uncharacterized membrane protein YhaH (DUF805 family)